MTLCPICQGDPRDADHPTIRTRVEGTVTVERKLCLATYPPGRAHQFEQDDRRLEEEDP